MIWTIYFVGPFIIDRNEYDHGEMKMKVFGDAWRLHISLEKLTSLDSIINSEFKYVIGLHNKSILFQILFVFWTWFSLFSICHKSCQYTGVTTFSSLTMRLHTTAISLKFIRKPLESLILLYNSFWNCKTWHACAKVITDYTNSDLLKSGILRLTTLNLPI